MKKLSTDTFMALSEDDLEYLKQVRNKHNAETPYFVDNLLDAVALGFAQSNPRDDDERSVIYDTEHRKQSATYNRWLQLGANVRHNS